MGDNLSNLAQGMAEFAAYCRADVPVSSLQQSPQTVSSGSISSPTPKDQVIQGKMFLVQSIIPQYEFERFPAGEIKRKMILQLVEELLNQDCIEFTMTKELSAMDEIKVRARIFATPDSQVKLLREKGY